MYFDADCLFNKNPLQIAELLNFSGICLTLNQSPSIRYKNSQAKPLISVHLPILIHKPLSFLLYLTEVLFQ